MVLETMQLNTSASRLPPFYYGTNIQKLSGISKYLTNFFEYFLNYFPASNNQTLIQNKAALLPNKAGVSVINTN